MAKTPASATRSLLRVVLTFTGAVVLNRCWEWLVAGGRVSFYRFEQTSDISFLQASVACFRTASSISNQGVGEPVEALTNLSSTLVSRFELIGQQADLDEAILLNWNALEVASLDGRHHAYSLNNLAVSLITRFDHNGDIDDLEAAKILHESALELRPPGHPDRSMSLTNIGNVFITRFRQFGDLADLDKAIRSYQMAVELDPPGHPNRHVNLNNLGSALMTRYDQSGHSADLDEAVVTHQRALELRPPGSPYHSMSLNNVANTLFTRFKRDGMQEDMDKAIFNYQKVVELRPLGHPHRSTSLDHLATALRIRFDRTGNRADLDEAMVNQQSALSLRPPGHPQRSQSLCNMGAAFSTRFQTFKDRADLRSAIDCYRNALQGMETGSPLRSHTLYGLASDLLFYLQGITPQALILAGILAQLPAMRSSGETKHVLVGDEFSSLLVQLNRMEITRYLKEATSVTTGGSASNRLQASLLWIKVSILWGDSSVIEAYRIAIGLLETLIASGSTLESRHQHLTSAEDQMIRTLAGDAATCAIQSGMIALAVEMLEQGRNVLLTQAGQYRTRVDDLELTHPGLAARFRVTSLNMESCVMAVGHPGMENASDTKIRDPVAAYQKLYQEWNDIVEEIRALDGFSTFLKPTPFSVLREASASGPVIILNLNSLRTDAIIVTLDREPIVVPLSPTPDLATDVSEKTHGRTDDRGFQRVLRKIWSQIVKPIVDVLRGDLRLPLGSRIWWCPCGTASLLPLHAAGDYTVAGQNLPDLFVSSYTPTLSALVRTRQKSTLDGSTTPNILVIGQSETPGQSGLPSVSQEVEKIKELVGNVTVLNGPDGTRDSVLNAMRPHPWVHLACHGHVNEIQPFQSNFSLHDGPLTLLDITRQTLPQADLAFLSACHSAAGNRGHPDEVLHLTAAMQFAGFRSVVGTLWAVCDLDGPIVAESFYSSMLGIRGRTKAGSSAHALHRAVAELRMNESVSISRWACFVHYGC